jgi:hypothetical protein
MKEKRKEAESEEEDFKVQFKVPTAFEHLIII